MPTQRVPPLYYTNFEGGARAEKRDFLVKNFPKIGLVMSLFFVAFFQKISCGAENLVQMGFSF